MRWLTRPWIMAAASAALVVGAALLIVRVPAGQAPAAPLAVADGDREVAWLYTAVSAASWERFVAAVKRAGHRLQGDLPGVQAEVGDVAFPKETAAVPQVALSLPGKDGRLVFRWYKITSDWKTADWVDALLKRRPAPLAIVGGSSSDAARELAWMLASHGAVADKHRPLLLLTTATADRVADPDPKAAPGAIVDLTRIYADRTFRYCFSNRQMAAAVMHFIESQDDLRPAPGPVHMVQWDDDSYSRDLTDGFRAALPESAGLTNPMRVASSVGSFLAPNWSEADVAEQLVQDLERQADADRKPEEATGGGRPLLIVTGSLAPSRRFLRELARTAPARTRRLVVVTGDAVSFDTVYRDRRVTWPIQDLPFPFVFFRHYDPIHNKKDDPDLAFLPEGATPPDDEKGFNLSDSGTEEVLLDSVIIESVAEALERDGKPAPDAAELGQRLAEIQRWPGRFGYGSDGVPLFGSDGNRRGGAGENIVCIRPHFERDRVLPEAMIEVWVSRESVPNAAHPWELHDKPLTVSYEPPVAGEKSGP